MIPNPTAFARAFADLATIVATEQLARRLEAATSTRQAIADKAASDADAAAIVAAADAALASGTMGGCAW